MQIDWKEQVQQLIDKHSSKALSKKSQKFSKVDDKKINQLQKAVEAYAKPQFSLKTNLYFLSENGLICLSDPEYKHDKILGQIPGSFFSYSHRVGKVAYDFQQRYLRIQMELLQTEQIPLGYVKTLYKGFPVDEQPRALQVIDKCQINEYHILKDAHPFLYEENWMDHLFENEELPSMVQRIFCVTDRPQFEFLFNLNYMRLIGVLPNILIDVILQSQQLPEIALTSDLYRWSDLTEGFIKSMDQPVFREHKTMVMTYEGMRVGVIIREKYLHTYNKDTNCHYYVRKITYQVTNPKAYEILFDEKRVCKNSLNYLLENQTNDINKQMKNELLVITNSDVNQSQETVKICGFKLKPNN